MTSPKPKTTKRALRKGDRVKVVGGEFYERHGRVVAFFPEVPSYQVEFVDAESSFRCTYFRHNLRALPRPKPTRKLGVGR